MIFHDSDDPDLILQIIDLKNPSALNEPLMDDAAFKTYRDQIMLQTLRDYSAGLQKFKKNDLSFVPNNDAEERLKAVYLSHPDRKKRAFSNQIKIRAQSGLADKFRRAAETASEYLSTMEEIFLTHGLPPSLTRMAFVESMFNIEAKSKVGASGIWQFMPETARLFMYVNNLVDERNSPIKATRAAAQLLLKNYAELGSWPHAITAYNHGTYGMLQAIKKTGSLDFDKTILQYESPSFGFASKNFYGEFIAARRVYYKIKSQIQFKIRPKILDSVVLDSPMSLQDISKVSGLDIGDISRYNHCILPETVSRNYDKPLPKFFEFFAPKTPIEKLRKKMTQQISQNRNF